MKKFFCVLVAAMFLVTFSACSPFVKPAATEQQEETSKTESEGKPIVFDEDPEQKEGIVVQKQEEPEQKQEEFVPKQEQKQSQKQQLQK